MTFDSAALSGEMSTELVGTFTAQEALRRLLEGKDVTFRRGAQGVWMVRPRQRSPATTTSAKPNPMRLTVAPRSPGAPAPSTDRPALKPWNAASSAGPDELEELVVSASRIPQEWRRTSSSVSVISMPEMAKLQVSDLKSSLAQQVGVNVVTTGTVGGGTSVYIRGAYPHHTLFIVDGVRMNDRSAGYEAFLGGSSLGGIDRVEVLRGPQSPMYGSAAMGGVVLVDTAKGNGRLSGNVSASVGSFATLSGAATAVGNAGPLGYSVALGRFTTDNDQPSNGFKSSNYSARLDYVLSPEWEIGLTYRGQEGEYESTGSRSFYIHGIADSATDLATLRAQWRPSEAVSSRVIVAYHRREYRWLGDASRSDQLNERKSVEWQGAWAPAEDWSFVVGASFERSSYEVNSSMSEDEIVAGFFSGTWVPTDAVTLTAGIRQDRFESVGNALTWRAGAAWMIQPETKVRATYGAGFAAPGSSDRYGVPVWGQLPNPLLRPEKSRGWDVGVDRSFLGGALTLSTTWFDNRFRDLIDWTYTDTSTLQGMYVNRRRASTRGVEVGVAARPLPYWHLRLGYTYLDGTDDDTGERLRRRPRESVDVSGWLDLTPRWTVGLGLRGVYDRVESVGPIGSYSVARLFSSFELRNRISIKVRAENLFGERYDEVYGYAALPRGIYGSVEWQY